jgi:hypothetical protein
MRDNIDRVQANMRAGNITTTTALQAAATPMAAGVIASLRSTGAAPIASTAITAQMTDAAIAQDAAASEGENAETGNMKRRVGTAIDAAARGNVVSAALLGIPGMRDSVTALGADAAQNASTRTILQVLFGIHKEARKANDGNVPSGDPHK